MGGALGIGLALGGLSALTSFAGAERSRDSQLAQASQARSQADAIRAQAATDRAQAEAEARDIDRRKIQLRREFAEKQSRNRALLGAGNVDTASGSALDVAYGNIDALASDLGDNAYQRALKIWEGKTREQNLNYQARTQDANASWLTQSAGNIGTSILTGAISGAGGFAQGYSLAGGSLKSLFALNSANGLPAISPGAASFAKTSAHTTKLAEDILNFDI